MEILTLKASSLSKNVKPRVIEYKFSTDYNNIHKDGVNTQLDSYNVIFSDNSVVINNLDSLLEGLGGTTPFEWAAFLDFGNTIVKKFTCDEWEVSENTPGKSVLTATFTEQP